MNATKLDFNRNGFNFAPIDFPCPVICLRIVCSLQIKESIEKKRKKYVMPVYSNIQLGGENRAEEKKHFILDFEL